jgi:hypothetical protein
MTHSDEILIHKILKFAIDLRNIRIIMSTDGMNPVMNSSTHSTWPIVLMILNLPSLLCNKQKYIMMPGLVLRPQQPENDINTYFRPMVEDLKALSYINRVQVWDEHKREYFGLKDILFVTFSDSPTESKNTKKLTCGKGPARIVVYMLMLMMLWAKTNTCTMVKYKRSGSLIFMVSRFLFSIATGLMQPGVLYKTSTCSLALNLTVKDISQSLLC